MRGGTECLYGIVGLSKAMEVVQDLDQHHQHIYTFFKTIYD